MLDEFVYYGKRMLRVENPLTQIINSIIGFLQSGVYNDTTGVAFKNTSPQTNDNNKLNCNTNMNKKLIRLTESDLHRIVKESVKRVLRESNESTPSDIAYGLMVMLGEIHNELMRGGDPVTIDEIDKLYGMAVKLNDYFDSLTESKRISSKKKN